MVRKQAIFVSGDATSQIEEAVRRGGGEVSPNLENARAVVWLDGDLSDLKQIVERGVDWIQLPSAGVARYVEAGILDGPHVTTCAGPAFADSVAEHALALLLSCARMLPTYSRAKSWLPVETRRLQGSRVAIVGSGRVGRALIRLLEPFHVHIRASNQSGTHVPGSAKTFPAGQMRSLLKGAGFVVLTAPSTPKTDGLFGSEEFALMNQDSYLINVSRGSLVDTNALEQALSTGAIAGAALDVTDPEPLPSDHPLWRMDNVMITPHVANPETSPAEELSNLVETNVKRFLAGSELLGIVDAGRGY